MILKVFILVLVVEIIANKPPSQYWAGGPIIRHPSCQPAKIFWCSRHGVHPDPWLYISDPDYYGPKPMPIFFGPFFPIPPVKCGPSPIIPPVKVNAPDPDGPGPVNVPIEPYRPNFPYDPTWPKGPILYGPFVPIPPVKCGPFVPIPPVKTKGDPDIDRDKGCGPEPYTPRDPTRPKWRKRLLPCAPACVVR